MEMWYIAIFYQIFVEYWPLGGLLSHEIDVSGGIEMWAQFLSLVTVSVSSACCDSDDSDNGKSVAA